jgi:hypothetical protein
VLQPAQFVSPKNVRLPNVTARLAERQQKENLCELVIRVAKLGALVERPLDAFERFDG